MARTKRSLPSEGAELSYQDVATLSAASPPLRRRLKKKAVKGVKEKEATSSEAREPDARHTSKPLARARRPAPQTDEGRGRDDSPVAKATPSPKARNMVSSMIAKKASSTWPEGSQVRVSEACEKHEKFRGKVRATFQLTQTPRLVHAKPQFETP